MMKYFFTESGELTELHKNLHSLVKIGLALFIVNRLNKI